MVPKLQNVSHDVRFRDKDVYIPKSLLDAANIIAFPVPLHYLFLSHGHTCPGDPHVSDAVHIILVENDLLATEVSFGPLT